MRAQISLQFDDEDLYSNFVVPYKEQRVLNSVIIKCLSAYYYNEEVRNLIEGTSMEEVTDGEGIQSTQSLCDSIRASLMMQDFLTSELQNTIANGTEDITNILNQTNDLAKKSGVAKASTSEYKSEVLQIAVNNTPEDKPQVKDTVNIDNTDFGGILKVLVNAVTKLAETSGNSEVVHMLHDGAEPVEQPTQQVKPETVSSVVENKVPIEPVKVEPEIIKEPEPVVEVKKEFVTEEVVSQANDFEADTPVETATAVEENNSSNDASSDMLAFLGSL
jgi:hypothetical protein